MPEKPQVHQVWITGMVTWSIQPLDEHVFVVYASSVEALAHPFSVGQLTGKGKISAVILAAQTVLAPGLQQWQGSSKSPVPSLLTGWGELVSLHLQAVVAPQSPVTVPGSPGPWHLQRATIFCFPIFSRLMGEVIKFHIKGQGSVLQLCCLTTCKDFRRTLSEENSPKERI